MEPRDAGSFGVLGTELAAENAAGGAGFGDDDFDEEREGWFEASPDPERDLFAGRVVQAGDIVEVPVVELFPERAEGSGEIGIIDEPTELGIAGAGDGDFDLEAMAVEASALVGVGEFGEEMGGLELEGFA
jgi:hypothetical protein